MKVCIDIQAALSQQAGVGRYVKSLVRSLGEGAGADSISLFYFDFMRRGIPFETPGASQKAVRWLPGRIAQKAWLNLGWPPFDLLAGAFDVYHFPNFLMPPLRRGKTVVSIHDTVFLRMPETVESRNLRYLTAGIRATVARADAIITGSNFIAREIADLLGGDRSRIHAIHLGISDRFSPAPADAVTRDLQSLSVTQPYLLAVGTIEPRKNIPFLVETFERMDKFRGQLVVAGMPGWKCGPIFERMRNSRRAADIRYLSYVTDSQLQSLYTGADLLVFPSLYEGFGFPPLEAMACGTPVLAAATGSLPEILGREAVLLEGFDADQWANAAIETAGNRSRAARAEAHARSFSWTETARKTWEVYRKIAKCA